MKATKWRSWPRSRCLKCHLQTSKSQRGIWWMRDLGEGVGGAPQKQTSLEKLYGLLLVVSSWKVWRSFFPDFRVGVFFPLMGVSGGLWQFCQQDPLQEWYDPLLILTHKRMGPSKECKIENISQCIFFSRKAGGGIFIFKKVFVSFSSKGTFLKIKPRLFVCLMIIQTLALVKELSTIHKPSHVMIFVYLLLELCVLLSLGIPDTPSVPEVVTLVPCQNLKCLKISADCNSSCCLALHYLVASRKLVMWMPWKQHISMMSRLWRPPAPDPVFSKVRFNLGRTWRYKWWENTRGTLKEQEFRSWVLVTNRCSNTQAQKTDDSIMT